MVGGAIDSKTLSAKLESMELDLTTLADEVEWDLLR